MTSSHRALVAMGVVVMVVMNVHSSTILSTIAGYQKSRTS